MTRKEVLDIVNECFRCYATDSRWDAKEKAIELMDKMDVIKEKNKLEKQNKCKHCFGMGAKYVGVMLGSIKCPECGKY